jgi:hypothetical protein
MIIIMALPIACENPQQLYPELNMSPSVGVCEPLLTWRIRAALNPIWLILGISFPLTVVEKSYIICLHYLPIR